MCLRRVRGEAVFIAASTKVYRSPAVNIVANFMKVDFKKQVSLIINSVNQML